MPRNRCEDARGLRGRLTEEEGVLAPPDRPSRCTLPITALRVMPPSSMAIRLAESPSAHSFFRSSTRSSVHIWPLHQQSIVEGRVARPIAHRFVRRPVGPPDGTLYSMEPQETVRRTRCRT